MEDNKSAGARNSLQTMMYYYLYSLVGTVKDPKQVIATELAELIELSEEQLAYVRMDLQMNNKLLDNLSSSIKLLENIEKTGKLDLESIKIVHGLLSIMNDNASKVIADLNEEYQTGE